MEKSELIRETTKGKVQGITDDGLNMWKGIPFAKPPIGELRFKRAVPMDKWNGVKVCDKFGNKPIQFMGIYPGMPIDETENEDCLYLNIWAPKDAKKLPVFVWMYGGAYHYGYGDDPNYDGSYIANQNVIFVNFNYRVGPLGFYNFSMYDPSFESNCAISDQLEALKWVNENIEFFGGDPYNITIAGESAGGTAVYDMMACPDAKGLFNKAISQSGVAAASGNAYTNKLNADLFLEKMGIKPEEIDKLKTVPAVEMKEVGDFIASKSGTVYPGMFPAGPVIGDDLLPKYPWEAIAEGSAAGVDMICGSNRNEGGVLVAPEGWAVIEELLRMHNREGVIEDIRAYYSKYPDAGMQLAAFGGDQHFVVDHIRCANAQIEHGNVWVYRSDFVSVANEQNNAGAAHASETSFTLGNIDDGFLAWCLKGTPDDVLHNMRDQFNGAWVHFIKAGKPNKSDSYWPKYNDDKCIHVFDEESHNEKGDHDSLINLWDKIGRFYTEEIL